MEGSWFQMISGHIYPSPDWWKHQGKKRGGCRDAPIMPSIYCTSRGTVMILGCFSWLGLCSKTCARKTRSWVYIHDYSNMLNDPFFIFIFNLFHCRATKAWRLLSNHGAAQPAVWYTFWPAPALCWADWSGVCERLRGAGHAGWSGTRHWRRYAHVCPCIYTETHAPGTQHPSTLSKERIRFVSLRCSET